MAQHVVIIGGGFAGLHAALELKDPWFQVTVLDRRNFHLFQPLLYQVATGALSPANIAAPLREVLKRHVNTQVLLAEVVDFDVAQRQVILRDGRIGYDTLIVAAGMQNHYFGHPEWEKHAPGLKSVEDATEFRRRILLAFEAAERELDPEKRRAWLTFVVIGGGPTGVELAGALGDLARDTLKRDFRAINPADARILLLEGAERILLQFPQTLSRKAEASLRKLGVTVQKAMVTGLDDEGVTTLSNGKPERISAHTVLWAAGVKASSLGQALAEKANAKTDAAGRVIVDPDLTIPGHPEIFVLGDLAAFLHQSGKPLPAIAPVAMQEGRYVAEVLDQRRRGEPVSPFRYKSRGSLATIGRAAAVAEIGPLRFSGFFAWLLWLFVHLFFLIGFENRVLVFLQWAWSYFTWNRRARLITGHQNSLPKNPVNPVNPV